MSKIAGYITPAEQSPSLNNMMNSRTLIASLAILNLVIINSVSGEQTSFKPGEVWRDTDGNPIDAHGGGFLYHDGVYYWYGEIKNSRTYTPEKNTLETVGELMGSG